MTQGLTADPLQSAPNGIVGVPYTFALTASSGMTSNLTWSVMSGSLPEGLSLDPATGVISGTPTAQFDSALTVEVNAAGETATIIVIIAVYTPMSLTGSDSLYYMVGDQAATAIYSTGAFASTLSIDFSDVPVEANIIFATDTATGTLSFSSASPISPFTVTITATGFDGQTDSITVTLQAYSQLAFEDVPSNGVIAYAV